MVHVVTFSGGKDSLATLLWAKKNLVEKFEVVFYDTGWESEVTMRHVQDVEKALKVKIIQLQSEYTFEELAKKKKRVPSTKARFCTEWLKVRPMIDYLLQLDEDTVVYQGIRADESPARRKMKQNDEYFAGYERGDKNATYRKRDVLRYIERYSVDVIRPIFHLNTDQVFDMIRSSGIAPNPLYRAGFSRVGCFPCIMCRHGEVRQLIKNFPERIAVIRQLEQELGRSFFPPRYIPNWACANGKFPWIDEVVAYLHNPRQQELFQPAACQSVYAICE